MRIAVLAILTVLLGAAPYATGRRLLSLTAPGATVAVALMSLIGLATSSLFLLVAVVDPADLPARAIPGLIERCVGAAGQVLAHPLRHWPRIVAAVLLIAFLARLTFALLATIREVRRCPSPVGGLRLGELAIPEAVVLDDDQPIAHVGGVVRRQIVVSTGLLEALDPSEIEAVLAHERSHYRGWHTSILLVGRVIGRSFGFFPPVRAAVDQMILGLEVSADDAATAEVGDPLIVARALARLAELRMVSTPATQLGAAESELLYRVRRLTATQWRFDVPRPKRAIGSIVGGAVLALLLGQLLILPASGRTLGAAAQAREEHLVCHLPHDTNSAGATVGVPSPT